MRYLRYFENMESLTLCDIDIEWARDHFDPKFGDFEGHLDPERGNIDVKISKCLKLNDEIIGCYCLSKITITECIFRLKYWAGGDGDLEEDEIQIKDLKFFVPEKTIKRIFKGKDGIFGDYLYILPEHRNKQYADVLIKYSQTLTDYNWGITGRGEPENFWINKKHRTKICEYIDGEGKVCILNSTLPK